MTINRGGLLLQVPEGVVDDLAGNPSVASSALIVTVNLVQACDELEADVPSGQYPLVPGVGFERDDSQEQVRAHAVHLKGSGCQFMAAVNRPCPCGQGRY